MGMVLPEGVLNTSNLQKVREYFEGRAKIILICSIPQDVFNAAGATVKPSLVFFKRFTEEEEAAYAANQQKAFLECYEPYREEAERLTAERQALVDAGKGRSREAKALQRQLDALVNAAKEQAKPLVKSYFDYEIPIAKVDDAGITSTGAESAGNQLPGLEKAYTAYRRAHHLWAESERNVTYELDDSGEIVRVMDGRKEILHGKSE